MNSFYEQSDNRSTAKPTSSPPPVAGPPPVPVAAPVTSGADATPVTSAEIEAARAEAAPEAARAEAMNSFHEQSDNRSTAKPTSSPPPVAGPPPVPGATPVTSGADATPVTSGADATPVTSAEIETMKADALENQKRQQKSNTYVNGIMNGIKGYIGFPLTKGRENFMKGKMSNIASENTENTSNKVLQILKTYDENMNMLIQMKEKYLELKQNLISLDMDNIGGEEFNKKMIEVTKKIHDVDADILENIVGSNNLVLQVQAPQIGIEKEVISFPSRGNGNIQPYYDNQREKPQSTSAEKPSLLQRGKQFFTRKNTPKAENTLSPTAENTQSKPAEKPPSPPVEKPSFFKRGLQKTRQFFTRNNTLKKENAPSPPAGKPPSPPVENPSLFKRGLQKTRQLFTRKIPQQSQSTAVAVGGGNANNKTRKNRQYIHEIKENREHLFTKEMEIIKSIRNFKHGQDKKENIEKKFIKTITRS